MKPKLVYHSSQNKNIEIFEPRAESIRHVDEGPVVFAGESIVEVSRFIVPCDDSWSQLSKFDGGYVAIYADKERFIKSDKGGAIYTLPSKTFFIDEQFCQFSREWTSKVAVKPVAKIEYISGLQAMLENGVKVYFVTPEVLKEIKTAPDHGYSILKSLAFEKKK